MLGKAQYHNKKYSGVEALHVQYFYFDEINVTLYFMYTLAQERLALLSHNNPEREKMINIAGIIKIRGKRIANTLKNIDDKLPANHKLLPP